MIDRSIKVQILTGSVIFILLAAYIYSAQAILSPIPVGLLLLFVISGIKDNPFAERLKIAIWGILIIWMFIRAQVIFFPFIVSFTLAYILDPVADFLVKHRFKRGLASIILVLLFCGLIVMFGFLMVPTLVQEINNLISSLPRLVDAVQIKVLENLPKVLHFLRIEETQFKKNLADTLPGGLQQLFNNLLKGLMSITSFVGQILNIIIIPVLTFYILKDFNSIRQWFLSLFTRRKRPRVSYYLWRINRIVGGYLRAQVIICTFVGIMTGLGLAFIARIQFAVLLGVLAGLLNFIPYIGLYVGLILTGLVAFLDPNPLFPLIKIVIVYAVVQGVEGAIIQPKIVGDRVGLHPVAVMFSVLFFAKFFGFWGLVIGVPSAAVVMFFIDEWKRKQALLEMIDERALKTK
ncbi:AI-2E family transporter [bacterium]|nr:AI-2E family transporter [bacterium]RQV98397.1 MAG: AI-2E family transporter [bacterium]